MAAILERTWNWVLKVAQLAQVHVKNAANYHQVGRLQQLLFLSPHLCLILILSFMAHMHTFTGFSQSRSYFTKGIGSCQSHDLSKLDVATRPTRKGVRH
ncbi:unnamed protein product [Protopolystoma xenopodis]|uniref:Uncharacterized protein n=1 Tax=Protopolystoma xenopodis TaxID=117903 RepID=A0A448WEB4_9PLAT|nr:unnamed protein product [Protopolystoma xenopodis]